MNTTGFRIQIGRSSDIPSLVRVMGTAGVEVSHLALSTLSDIKLSGVRKFLDLAILSVNDLNFPQGAPLRDIFKAAAEGGYDLCPAEAGPELCLQVPISDWPSGDEWWVLAMEPIKHDEGSRDHLFHLGTAEAHRCLFDISGAVSKIWSPVFKFVFMKAG